MTWSKTFLEKQTTETCPVFDKDFDHPKPTAYSLKTSFEHIAARVFYKGVFDRDEDMLAVFARHDKMASPHIDFVSGVAKLSRQIPRSGIVQFRKRLRVEGFVVVTRDRNMIRKTPFALQSDRAILRSRLSQTGLKGRYLPILDDRRFFRGVPKGFSIQRAFDEKILLWERIGKMPDRKTNRDTDKKAAGESSPEKALFSRREPCFVDRPVPGTGEAGRDGIRKSLGFFGRFALVPRGGKRTFQFLVFQKNESTLLPAAGRNVEHFDQLNPANVVQLTVDQKVDQFRIIFSGK